MTGKPILANDPHLELDAPILWYLARIVTPEGSVKGATVPGTPLVLLGQNDRIAWGVTTADTDAAGPVRRDDRPRRSDALSDARRAEAVLDARRDHPRQGRGRRRRLRCAPPGTGRCSPTSTADSPRSPDPARRSPSPSPASATSDTTAEGCCVSTRRGTGTNSSTRCALPDADPELRLRRRRRRHRLHQPRPAAAAQIGRRARAGRRRLGRRRLDRNDPLRAVAAICTIRRLGFIFNANNAIVAADHQPTFGRDWEEAFRARRIQQFFDATEQAQPRRFGGDAGRPFFRSTPRTCCRSSKTVTPTRRARAPGAGAARRLGRRDGQGPRRAADLHGVPDALHRDHAGRQDRPFAEREGPVRRRRLCCRCCATIQHGATRPGSPTPIVARRCRAPSTKGWRCWFSATAPT